MSGKFGPERPRGPITVEERRMLVSAATDVGDHIDAGVQAGMDGYGSREGLPQLRWSLQRNVSTGESVVTGAVSRADFAPEARVPAAEEWAAALGLTFDYEIREAIPDVLEWNGSLDDGRRLAVWVAPDRWRREEQE